MIVRVSLFFFPSLINWRSCVDDDDDDIEEHIYSFVEEIASNYIDDQLEKSDDQEITFSCDKYYLVDPKYYQAICDYLNK